MKELKKQIVCSVTLKEILITLNENTFILLYKSLVSSQLKYGASVWYPHKKELVNIVEGVQQRATKLIPQIK